VTRMGRRRVTGPIAEVRMRLGHRMLVDLRAPAQREAFRTGRYDDALVGFALGLMAEPGSVAVDVGANVGFWTVPLALRAASLGGRVYAFEPVPANRDRLVANARLNEADDRVTVVPVALSDREGTTAITLREEFAGGATTGNAAILIDDGEDDRFQRLTVSEWNRVYYERRGVDPTVAVGAVLAPLGYAVLRRVDARRWAAVDGFSSPRPVDDVVLAPEEQVRRTVALLNG
jgi:FkbM family methyltransferase